MRRAAFLTVEMLRPIPSVALLPLSLLIFGFGYRMEVAVIAFATFWPSLILTQSAVAQIEPRLIEVARLHGPDAAADGLEDRAAGGGAASDDGAAAGGRAWRWWSR